MQGVGGGGDLHHEAASGPKMEVFLQGWDRLLARGCSGRLWQFNKARPSAVGWRFAVCSIPFGWLTQTTVVCWDMCVWCVYVCGKKSPLLYLLRLSRVWAFLVMVKGGEKHQDSKGESRERGKQASLLSSWLSRGSLYSLVGVHTLVWRRVHFLTGQQDSQKETIRMNMDSIKKCPSVPLVH